MIGSKAATVFADIDDNAILSARNFIQLLFESVETRHVHALDMQIGKLAVRSLSDRLPVIANPLFVEKTSDGRVGSRTDGQRPFLLFCVDYF